MIKAVLFDFGGVLTEGGTSGCIQRAVGAVYGLPPQTINADTDLMLAARAGQLSEAKFFTQMNARHPNGPRLTRDNFLQQSADIFVRSQPVYDLAAQLRQHGIRTGIVSNIYDFVAEELRRRGLYDGFDPVVLSCAVGTAKPDPRIYQLAIDQLALQPSEILFVDDIDRCYQAAKRAGMPAVLATSPQQIVSEVKIIIKQENGLAL